jgi:hypothetical protein
MEIKIIFSSGEYDYFRLNRLFKSILLLNINIKVDL